MTGTFSLVVDDSKSARFAMRRFLENSGQEVDTAESGLDALEKIRQRKPDILFLDHIMPVLDGFGVVEMLKRDPAMAAIPVVLCTSNESAEFAQLARTRGVREILIKPPSAPQLDAMLQRLNDPAAASVEIAAETALQPPFAERPREPIGDSTWASLVEPIPQPPQAAPSSADRASPEEPFFAFVPEPPASAAAASVEPIPTPAFVNAAPGDPGPIPNRVQTIRDPEDAIERAVMKTLRDALPEGIFAAAAAPSVPARPTTMSLVSALAQPASLPENTLAPRIEALRDQFQNRMQQVSRELIAQIGSLRTQLTQLETAGSMARGGDDERLSTMQQSQFMLESRIERMAAHVDGVLETLRKDLDSQYQEQTQRIERIGREARAAAVDEAHAVSERIVMNAAKRISDQVAESVLNVLKPAPTQHFR